MIKKAKYYTAEEIIEILSKKWETKEELKELIDFAENAKMTKKEEKKLCDDGILERLETLYYAIEW